MNADDLNKLPRYIEAPGGGMWGPMPDGFTITNEDAVFVKLKDVQAMVTPAFVSVGRGGEGLVESAKTNGWNLYASLDGDKELTPGWYGGNESKEYFIKKV